MIEYITIGIMLVLPILWTIDVINQFFVNAQRYIDDDRNAWTYKEWKYTNKFMDLASNEIAFAYVVATVVMTIGYIISYAAGPHNYNHDNSTVTYCFIWWVSTVSHTIYLGGFITYATSMGILTHLRALRRLAKAKKASNTLNIRK